MALPPGQKVLPRGNWLKGNTPHMPPSQWGENPLFRLRWLWIWLLKKQHDAKHFATVQLRDYEQTPQADESLRRSFPINQPPPMF
jgi:hypothetical protein